MDFADSSHIRRLGDDIVNGYIVAESGTAVAEVRRRAAEEERAI